MSDPMLQWVKDLYPICRSITGPGVRETLAYLKRLLPDLVVHAVPTGTQAFDWTVPDEWAVRDAYIADASGRRIVDFRQNNLHVVGYSTPVDQWLSLEELRPHLHSLPGQPDAIPYEASYYTRRWGFCLPHAQLQSLREGKYHAVIDSDLKPGVLNYGELILPGETQREVLLSTYICHPSMANNELSGPVVTAALARWLALLPKRRFTYRIVFVPETIGAIVYLSRNADHMKKHTVAGFVLTCVGDDRTYSFLPSRSGITLADQVARHALRHHTNGKYDTYSYLQRGSDERQYCSPGIDLPVCLVMRSKFGTYPEYHSSQDNLDLVTQSGLEGGFAIHRTIIELLEKHRAYQAVFPCEPQLGRRQLYNISGLEPTDALMNLLAYADGSLNLIGIAEAIGEDPHALQAIADKLVAAGLLRTID